MRRWLAALAAVLCMAAAADPTERLTDPNQEARARALFAEIRCLVCQNESIDDSQADLAGDLRRLVRDEIAAGRTDTQVRAYLVSRYGEFVLLKPSMSWGNLALWGAPFAVVVFGICLMILHQRRRIGSSELSPEETARLAQLAKEDAR